MIELRQVSLDFLQNRRARQLWQQLWGLLKSETTSEESSPTVYSARLALARPPALANISFGLRAGERVGLVGRNGAGKTTLLRLLAGVFRPTAGSLSVAGRVTPMLGVAGGLQPDLSGLANLRLAGTLLGLSASELERVLPEMIAFSGLGPALTAPVREYSTGMVARLGFAAAAFTRPEILLIDEALGVGDGAFRRRCAARLERLIDDSRLAVVCSHQVTLLERLCGRVLWLHAGSIVADGPAPQVLAAYQAFLDSEGNADPTPFAMAAAG